MKAGSGPVRLCPDKLDTTQHTTGDTTQGTARKTARWPMGRTVLLPLLLTSLVACEGPPDLGDMPGKAAIAACNRKLEQVTGDAGVDWGAGQAVAEKSDRYWRVEGESAAGHYYSCRINAVNGDFLTYVY